MKSLITGLAVVVSLVYPFLIYTELHYFPPRYSAILIGTFLSVKLILTCKKKKVNIISNGLTVIIILLVIILVAAVTGSGQLFFFIPIVINGGLFIIFGKSLFPTKIIIEKSAKLTVISPLTKEEKNYYSPITVIWTFYFVFNIIILSYFAPTNNLEEWSLFLPNSN